MISNLSSQLKEQGALDRMDEVMEEVPRVRRELGYPPLVTPTSQIVGTQATLNVLMGRYKMITKETKAYVQGLYGRSPGPIDPEIQRLCIGDETPITTRPADSLEPELPLRRPSWNRRASGSARKTSCRMPCSPKSLSSSSSAAIARNGRSRRSRPWRR